jgi:hypothetical protein
MSYRREPGSVIIKAVDECALTWAPYVEEALAKVRFSCDNDSSRVENGDKRCTRWVILDPDNITSNWEVFHRPIKSLPNLKVGYLR